MYNYRRMSSVILIGISVAINAYASGTPIEGVFGVAPMAEPASLAIWIPLEENESILGIIWYNNDGTRSFPTIRAIAGDSERPEIIGDAVIVGENVYGGTLGWSELTFEQPIASANTGIYIIFDLPIDGAFVGEGAGSGIGYVIGGGDLRSWVAMGGESWDAIDPVFQMAVEPVFNTDKSGSVLILGRATEATIEEEVGTESRYPITVEMNAFPNPFNPQTAILFTAPTTARIELTVFDIRGRKMRNLMEGTVLAGEHRVIWDGRNDHGHLLASGVYFVVLDIDRRQLSRRLVLVR